jgi:predicted Zn-dependent protease
MGIGMVLALGLAGEAPAQGGLFNAVKKAAGAVTGTDVPARDSTQDLVESGADLADSARGPRQDYELGYHVSALLLGKYSVLPVEHPATSYLYAVGSTLVMATQLPYAYRPYTFTVIDAPEELNAFAAPGGFVFITSGMLKFLQSEDELAAVLAHEIAHVELGHGPKSVTKETRSKFFRSLASVAVGQTAVGSAAGSLGTDAFDAMVGGVAASVIGGYSRTFEGNADKRGAEICLAVGYDPKVLADVLERFQSTTGSYGGASYPKERGKDLEKHVGKLKASDESVLPERTARFTAMQATL